MHTDNHTLHDTMTETLNRDIIFADFMNEIHRRANNKSPGPSGFTINMLKSLPSLTLQALFDSLNELWKSPDQDILPDTWYTRWLCLIPKDKFGPPNIDRIRPISLFEVIRKVWTSILITRITRVWKDLNILHPAQHGYQPNIGTDTELIQLLNVIEDAQEHSKPLIMTSYDTAKAFDSVNKSFMETAWVQLGIPLKTAKYLVAMDVLGETIIKTPHSSHILRTKGRSGITFQTKSTKETVQSFRARDGIGQGDSPSATAWVAIYDILLHAIDSVTATPYKFTVNDH